MVSTAIGETMTVGELVRELSKYPEDMPVCDAGYMGIAGVKLHTWEHSNHPFDHPDEEFVMIEI